MASRSLWSWRGLLSLAWKLALVGLLVIAGFAVYLDAEVQEKFSGKRWMLPAKVYARPLELYAGRSLQQADLVSELQSLGYRDQVPVNSPGAMHVSGPFVEFYSRGFQFYEGDEPAQYLRIRFNGKAIEQISAADGQAVAVARLDPLVIGGMYPAHNEDRILVRLNQAPQYFIDTLVAVEDRDYWQHWGVSPKAIGRAIYLNISEGHLSQGGSTLTQQLVKNFFLTNERKLKRKLEEALMAVLLETHYNKQEILEAYLNEVFLGQDGQRSIHGFGLASLYYFGQPFSELRLSQVALLVGLVKGPSYYNPRRHPERALERRNLVLDVLAEEQVVSPDLVARAKAEPLGVTPQGALADNAFPAFMDLVKRQLRQDYQESDLTEEGLRIFTSFDPIMQAKATAAMDEAFAHFAKRKNADQLQAAMVVTHPETGEVQALLGSREAGFAGFNRALDAQRPIGSLIKPVIYLSALERPSLYTLTSRIEDEPFTVRQANGPAWSPQNYDHRAHGSIPLYQALANSYNLSAVRVGMALGVPTVLNNMERLGVKVDWPDYPSMLLGAGALSPLQVATLYQPMANGGFNTPVRAIRSVLNVRGEPLGRYPFEVQQRFDPGAIYLLQYGMQQVMRQGTARSVYSQLPGSLNLAGKTGTTNDGRDSWFAGFSQDLLAVVWMGRDDNGEAGLTGASGALQIWTQFMRRTNPVSLATPMPSNVVEAWVDTYSGRGADAGCPDTQRIPYIRGSQPAPDSSCGGSAVPSTETDWLQNRLN